MSMTPLSRTRPSSVFDRIARMHWLMITLLCTIAAIGVLMHFSVAEGQWAGRPLQHATRFGMVMAAVMVVSLFDSRWWRWAAYPLYAGALLLLVGVEVAGEVSKGAQRWIVLGPVRLQPSEFMKIGIVLALARYYEKIDTRSGNDLVFLVPPLLMIAAPTALVMKQPDLGTALLIAGSGVGVMFLAGLKLRYIIAAAAVAIPTAVYAFFFVLHDYQRQRVFTFLNPDADPLGSGYHQLQSRIAVGAAGVFGRGYGEGPQSQLNFLPEKHTDFIFTMIVEEFGLFGAFVVLGLFLWLLAEVMKVAEQARTFGHLAVGGVAVTLALYVLINTAMVVSLLPVVGIPLPLLSFGGTAMLTMMVGMAIVLSVHMSREARMRPR